MRVLAVTSWGGACGIANYAEQLIASVRSADPAIELVPCPEGLDPAQAPQYGFDWILLNYHRGLHSRWTPEVIKHKGYPQHTKIMVVMHDTYGERPPDALSQQLHDLADGFVVHEPCKGLPRQVLIRQGVPGWEQPIEFEYVPGYGKPTVQIDPPWMKVPYSRPVLGTVGFNFPWKGFDRLAHVTAEAGWGYLVCSNNATDEDAARWIGSNPWTCVLRGYRQTGELVRWLGGCDATCFAYECANSGTSGAIRLGLAARKPVIAWWPCRQFRDLHHGSPGITWCSNFDNLPTHLAKVPIQRVDPGVAYLAHRDSWVNQGRKYAEIFRGVLA